MFLIAAWGKVMAGTGWGNRMVGFLNAQTQMPEWYRTIVDSIIIPNASIFGFLTAYGELFLAIALILGVFIRPAVLLGLVMVANFMFAKGHGFWVPSNHDSFYVFALILFYFNSADEFLGLSPWINKLLNKK
jgi:thiosulfate dehydrogenase [quinone] large subunit